jgi:hypothetical protein
MHAVGDIPSSAVRLTIGIVVLEFRDRHSLWTRFPSSVTLDSFQRMGWPQMTHFIGGSTLCLAEETSSGIGAPCTIKHSSSFVTVIPFLFVFRNVWEGSLGESHCHVADGAEPQGFSVWPRYRDQGGPSGIYWLESWFYQYSWRNENRQG